jgi:hypothetical protein
MKALKRRWCREDETEKSRRDALSKKKGLENDRRCSCTKKVCPSPAATRCCRDHPGHHVSGTRGAVQRTAHLAAQMAAKSCGVCSKNAAASAAPRLKMALEESQEKFSERGQQRPAPKSAP